MKIFICRYSPYIYIYILCNLRFFNFYIFRMSWRQEKIGKERDLFSNCLEDCKNSDLYWKKNFLSETSKLRKTVLQRGAFIIFPVTVILLNKTTEKKRRNYFTFAKKYFYDKLLSLEFVYIYIYKIRISYNIFLWECREFYYYLMKYKQQFIILIC